MKIKIKTPLITLKVVDNIQEGVNGYLRHDLPLLPIVITSAISEAIRLHNEVNQNLSS